MPRGYVDGYPATLGGKVLCVGYMTGPTSYVTPGGQPFMDSSARSIDWADGSITVSGTYKVYGQPAIVGNPQQWSFRWVVLASGAEVTAGTNLSGETFQFHAVYS